jgi:hypothetical protein
MKVHNVKYYFKIIDHYSRICYIFHTEIDSKKVGANP